MTTLLLPRSAGRLVCPAQARCVVVAPVLRRAGRATHSARCSAMPDSEQLQVVKAATLTSALGTFLSAGNVSAAQELASSTASATTSHDGRGLAGLGLGLATLALAQSASAADITTDVQKAVTSVSRDNRVLIIATVLLPVAGWVLFNISGPALNQINNMSNKQKNIARRARGVAGAIGISAASLIAAQQADAASEVAQLAAGDNRFLIIATVLLPVAAWVLFNITGPALNQINNMQNKQKNVSKNSRK